MAVLTPPFKFLKCDLVHATKSCFMLLPPINIDFKHAVFKRTSEFTVREVTVCRVAIFLKEVIHQIYYLGIYEIFSNVKLFFFSRCEVVVDKNISFILQCATPMLGPKVQLAPPT